jgi:hypothetical protein
MQIGKTSQFLNRNFKSQIDMKLLMLVIYFLIYLVGQGAYGIVVASRDK